MIAGTSYRILRTFGKVIKKHNKNFCTASQATICELLAKYQYVEIGTRTLRYHIRNLKMAGFIKSKKRTHRNKDGTLCLQTSFTCLTAWGYELMFRLTDNPWYKMMADKLKKKYWPKMVKTFAQREENTEEELRELRRRSQIKIKDLLAALDD